mgnify:CR=1 FL=1
MIGSEYIDLAQIAIWAFWIFFFGLVYYLRREDHREGYPLETDVPGASQTGWPAPREKKTYKLPH